MQLTTAITAATSEKITKEVRGTETLSPGGKLKVELGPEQELDVVCPSGKTWFATVHVHIVETNT